MLNDWQRIEKIVKWTGASSVNAFARTLGLNRAEILYQIKRGNNRISKDLTDIITSKYQELSKAWILTGEGTMLTTTPCPSYEHAIPYYRMDVVRLLMLKTRPEPSAMLSLPIFPGSEFAALYFGQSMAPEIPQGAIVIFKHTDKDTIFPGEMYLIISEAFHGIRYIRKEVDSPTLRLVPKNKEDYDEMLMETAQIEDLYIIKGIVINKAL